MTGLQLALGFILVSGIAEIRAQTACNDTVVTDCMKDVAAQYRTISTSGNVSSSQFDAFCSDVALASYCLQNNSCTAQQIMPANHGMLDSWTSICNSVTDTKTFLDNQLCIVRSKTIGTEAACNPIINPLNVADQCTDIKNRVICIYNAYAKDCGLSVATLMTTYQINYDQPMFNKSVCDLESARPVCSNVTVTSCMADLLAFFVIFQSSVITASQLDIYCSDSQAASSCLYTNGCQTDQLSALNQGVISTATYICTPANKNAYLAGETCIFLSEKKQNYVACSPNYINPSCTDAQRMLSCGNTAYVAYCGTDTARLLGGYFTRLFQPQFNISVCKLGYLDASCNDTIAATCMYDAVHTYTMLAASYGNITAAQMNTFCNDLASASLCILENGCDAETVNHGSIPGITSAGITYEGLIDGWSYICDHSPDYRKLFLDNQECIAKSEKEESCKAGLNGTSCTNMRTLTACGYIAYLKDCGSDVARVWSTHFLKQYQPMFDTTICILDTAVQDGEEYVRSTNSDATTPALTTTTSGQTGTGNRNNIRMMDLLVTSLVIIITVEYHIG